MTPHDLTSHAFTGPHLLWGVPTGVEWVVIAGIALLLFGKRLPGVARSMGQGINEFKRGLKDGEVDLDGDDDDVPAQKELPRQEKAENEKSS